MTGPSEADDEGVAAISARLAALQAERGYLLPHHGLMAVAAPDLLAAYAETYRAMTLRRRTLDDQAKEFVWLAILVATDEAEATHHIAKYFAAGGTMDGVEAAVRLTALARGAAAYRFVDAAWQPHLPEWNGRRSEAAARADIARSFSLEPGLVILADAATRICLGQWHELGWAIEDAYAAGVGEEALAEALMLTMFPAGVPSFVRAAAVWLDLIRADRVTASPRFRAWAAIGGQGGYDEAAGKAPPAEGQPPPAAGEGAGA